MGVLGKNNLIYVEPYLCCAKILIVPILYNKILYKMNASYYTIVFNTITKSGSGLIMNIIMKILIKEKSQLPGNQSINNFYWSGSMDIHEKFRLLCSHFFGPQIYFDTNYNFAKNNPDIKFFGTVRDPKDVIISSYNWIKNTNYNQQNINAFIPAMDREQYIKLSENEKILKLIESENIRCQYKRSIKFSSLENVKIYRFEDLTNNDKLLNIIIDIYQHLGIKDFDTKTIEKDISEGLYFGNKVAETTFLDNKTFFKGKKGCYKEYFSQDCINKFNEFYREEESLKVYNYIK